MNGLLVRGREKELMLAVGDSGSYSMTGGAEGPHHYAAKSTHKGGG